MIKSTHFQSPLTKIVSKNKILNLSSSLLVSLNLLFFYKMTISQKNQQQIDFFYKIKSDF